MYSDEARPAMTTETRGQNSWVNFGPHGEANRKASAADTIYADQKVGLLPAEFSDPPEEGGVNFSVLGGNTGNPELDRFMSKIGGEKPTLKQRWQRLTDGLADRLNQNIFDHLAGAERAEKLAGVPTAESGTGSARLAASLNDLFRDMMEKGHPVWDSTNEKTRAANVAGDHGFFDILQPLGDKTNTWLAYMVGKRANRLMAEGRESLFTQPEIDAAVALGQQHPEFVVAAQKYAAFKGKVLDFAEQAGIIDPESRAIWDNDDYIPFYRIMDEEGSLNLPGGGGVAPRRRRWGAGGGHGAVRPPSRPPKPGR
jgi:hypothetical protein